MENKTPSRAVAIIPCNDLDAAERWWNGLGISRPQDQGYDDYRMLADGKGAEVHLQTAVEGWIVPGRNPFGVYLYTPRVDELAAVAGDRVLGPSKAPEHKPWGMYEFALNGPDDLLVRIGWPSRSQA
ncbi:glyoxalase [Methylocella sp. CPCC 101449]|uniref:glyoxalase n=1 Tax=Methylocella sp. CPCC 101449 TaxID=2987531 RepID=UPI00288FCE79|nr:glyoxalase [Methylocella sp. CPCC 101449]MDT2020614.1 glyoxalase [Methylocella sp. CPCC 101449]